MPEPIWIKQEAILAIHSQQLAEHGGGDGIRSVELLESALGRPQNLYHYGNPAPSIADMAAAYGYGISRNHPFIDGNKRTALVACRLFLRLNGHDIKASQVEKYTIFLSLAAGDISEAELSAWLTKNIVSI